MPYDKNKVALEQVKISLAATDNDLFQVYRNTFVKIRALVYKFPLK